MKKILIAIVIAIVAVETIEHIVLPLIWLVVQRKRKLSASQQMVGSTAEVRSWDGTRGMVFVRGELWKARAAGPLAAGSKVVIHDIDGLTLTVAPASEGGSDGGESDPSTPR